MRKYASSTLSLRNLSICIAVLLASGVWAAAQQEQVLYSFPTNSGFAAYAGGLIADASGNLYGTTGLGGASNFGSVYELSPPTSNTGWNETDLYFFGDGEDGAAPFGNLVFDSAGNLYGTTSGGGSPNCLVGGCGTVFELSPPTSPGGSWTLTILYSFSGGNDGAQPHAGLVFDQAGNLYGTTSIGGGLCGSQGCGTVFELSPPEVPGGAWTEAVLYRFTGGSDGGSPFAPVVLDKAGKLYGTTAYGGSQDCLCGTVFELTQSGGTWAESVIHSFGTINDDGNSPYLDGPLLDKSGALVGTTEGGGAYGFGTVFGMLPPKTGANWTYEILYSFGASLSGGLSPEGGVIQADGVLYGTTSGGGSTDLGTIFQLTRTRGSVWEETGLYSFTLPNGANPEAELLLHNGALYGTTTDGGSAGGGTVFEIFK